MKNRYLLSALFLTALMPTLMSAQSPIDTVTEQLERRQMQRLADQQNRPGIHITAFKSDGCSGGMSHSWKLLANSLPPFAEYIGEQPPWEHCCFAHDRDYWQGETNDGFARREESDAELRACVRRTGVEQAGEIASRLNLPKDEITGLIELTSELMYHAVRVGGGPCTGLPWRWGHGWPECSQPLEPGNQI